VQLHQLTLYAFTQLSKYFWVVMSFGGTPNNDGFAKRYELHYQPKKVVADSFERYHQFSVVHFHARQDGEAGLTPANKNKWSSRWTKAWFYCKVPVHVGPKGGKYVHALHSDMSCLNFHKKPSFKCPDDNLRDGAFVWASKNIRGWDAVEEFVGCGVWPLAASVSFEQVLVGVMPVSKLKLPLPNFVATRGDGEDDAIFWQGLRRKQEWLWAVIHARRTKLTLFCRTTVA
jgi:hypothetical protein